MNWTENVWESFEDVVSASHTAKSVSQSLGIALVRQSVSQSFNAIVSQCVFF